MSSKLVLSLDGGGIRGAASARFLRRVEDDLITHHSKSLRDCIDFYAGTSTGSIIAIALATTDLSAKEIDELYSYKNAKNIFSRRRFTSRLFSPKYKGTGKTSVLSSYLGSSSIGAVPDDKHVLALTYSLEDRRPRVIKSTKEEYLNLDAYRVADASSAAPTFFPTNELQNPDNGKSQWLIDGGVTANNPTMCAIAEAKRAWEMPLSELRVVSVGTGHRTERINGKQSQKWGFLDWFFKGKLLEVLSDEHVVAYQAITIAEPGNYIRVDSEIKAQRGLTETDVPDNAMDLVSPDNIIKLRKMGDFWYQQYGEHVVKLLLNQYHGASLDRIDASTGQPIEFPGSQISKDQT